MPPENPEKTPLTPTPQSPQQVGIDPQQTPPPQIPPVDVPQNPTPAPPPAKTFPTKKLVFELAIFLVIILISGVCGYYFMNKNQTDFQNKIAQTEIEEGKILEPTEYIFQVTNETSKKTGGDNFVSFDSNFEDKKEFTNPELAKKLVPDYCASFADKKTFACKKEEELQDNKAKYIIYLKTEQKETILWDETIDHSQFKGTPIEVPLPAYFLESFNIIEVKNDNDLVLFSHSGVAKFDIKAKKFSWIYQHDFSSEDVLYGVAYSKITDSLYYPIRQYTPGQPARYNSIHIIKVNLTSGKGEKIWSKTGDLSFDGFSLSTNQDKVSFLIPRSLNDTESKDLVQEIDLKNNTSIETIFENKGNATKLLGFTHDGKGLLIFERNYINSNADVTRDYSSYVRLSILQDKNRKEIFKSNCETQQEKVGTFSNCPEYHRFDTLAN